MVIGSGIICSNIINESIKTLDNEDMNICKFKFRNFNSIDSNGNKKYSHYLCVAKNEVAKLISNNFIKGHKIFIIGDIEQNQVQNKEDNEEENKKNKLITTIEIKTIEFMGNTKDDDENTTQTGKSIDSILNGILTNRNKNNQNDVFI